MTVVDLFAMFQDYWHCCKELWEVKNTDEYWERVIEVLSEFTMKYDNKPFPRALAVALTNELERKHRGDENAM